MPNGDWRGRSSTSITGLGKVRLPRSASTRCTASTGSTPDEVPGVSVAGSVFGDQKDGAWVVYVPALLEAMGLVASRLEARRLQEQGGVRMDGEPVPHRRSGIEGEPPGQLAGSVWQVGRRKFARLEGVDR